LLFRSLKQFEEEAMSNTLTVVDHKRLAAITTVKDAKKVRDEIAAIQHYAKVNDEY